MEKKFDAQFDGHKILYHPLWLKRWSQDPFSVPPIYIEISPIGLCNHRCAFCAKEVMGYPKRWIPLELQLRFVDELAALRSKDPDGLGVMSLMFAGEGEPTLFRDLDKVITRTHHHDIEVGLTTNATGMTEKFTEATLPCLKWIKASINAGRRETYSLVHQAPPEHWDLVWRNLARAVEMREKLGLREGCEIGCQTVLLVEETLVEDDPVMDVRGRLVPANWQEAPDLARKAKETGLDHVVIKPYGQNPYSKGTMARYGNMSYAGFIEALEEIECEMSELNDDKFRVVFRWRSILEHGSDTRGYPLCLATPTAWAYLQSDGMVISCAAHNSNPNFDLGNVKEKTFKEIWWGDQRRQHIEFMKDFDISQCRPNCRMHLVNQDLDGIKGLNGFKLESKLTVLNTAPPPPNVSFI